MSLFQSQSSAAAFPVACAVDTAAVATPLCASADVVPPPADADATLCAAAPDAAAVSPLVATTVALAAAAAAPPPLPHDAA